MIGLKVKLQNADCVVASYRHVKESRLLEGIIPADEEELQKEAPLPVDLSAEDWKLYCDFIAAVANVEAQTNKKFSPNLGFVQDYFKDWADDSIIQLKRVGRYLDCQLIEESIKCFIGGLYSDYTVKEFFELVGIRDRSDSMFQKLSKEINQKYSQVLMRKLKEQVPELQEPAASLGSKERLEQSKLHSTIK